MFTIMGADGKEYGPVTAGKLHEWIAGGRANLQTKARRDGETDWKTLGDFPEFSQFGTMSGSPPAAAAIMPTVAPGGTADAIPTPVTGSAKEIADDLIARTTPLDVFGCLGQSFELWKANFLPLVGVTLLMVVIQGVTNVMLGMIPFVGFLVTAALSGAFYGGLYYYYLGKQRGEHREVGDIFAGFTKAFVPLMLASLLTTLLTLVLMAIFYAPLFLVIIQVLMHRTSGMPSFPAVGGLALGGMGVGFVVLIYLGLSWVFTLILVIDKGVGPWTAMEVSRRVVTHQWFRVFFVVLFGCILTFLGLIGFIIGIFLTLPLMIGAVIGAYEHLCNPPKSG